MAYLFTNKYVSVIDPDTGLLLLLTHSISKSKDGDGDAPPPQRGGGDLPWPPSSYPLLCRT